LTISTLERYVLLGRYGAFSYVHFLKEKGLRRYDDPLTLYKSVIAGK
jgi:hypothetical protein